jgi:hypothetical protein
MPNKSTAQLCPAQQSVLDSLLKGLQIGSIFRLWGGVGRDKRVEMKEPTNYFLKAVEGVRENKQRYAEAEAQALLKPKPSMSGFANFFMHKIQADGGGDE